MLLKDRTSLTMLGDQVEEEEIDMDMRAPYIPMSGDDDLIFNALASPVRLIDEFDEGPQRMLGTTESVFSSKEEDTDEETSKKKNMIPMSLLRQEAMQLKERQHQEMDHMKCIIKQRPSCETNRLETGPPVAKKARWGAPLDDSETDMESIPSPYPYSPNVMPRDPITTNVNIDSIQGSAVLKNLLVKGFDKQAGYDLQNINKNAKNNAEGSGSVTLRGLLTSPMNDDVNKKSVGKVPMTSGKKMNQEFSGGFKAGKIQPASITVETLDANGGPTGQHIVLTDEILQLLAKISEKMPQNEKV